jgi:hypothetical protein
MQKATQNERDYYVLKSDVMDCGHYHHNLDTLLGCLVYYADQAKIPAMQVYKVQNGKLLNLSHAESRELENLMDAYDPLGK